jgi:two-component system response regulator AtoC
MPGVDGMQLLRTARAEWPEMEVVVLTAHGTIDTAIEAMKLGAFDYLQKPLRSPTELRLVVARAVERAGLRAWKDRTARGEDASPLSYGDPAMAAVEDAIAKVARTDATVLLQGESGTGKEVAARALHRRSPRASGPFVAVNCAALSETLLASELFGHEKGAFTGAVARHRGRLELADGGTFFLDEVGELDPSLQAKLLRVLQEKRFERLGGAQTLDADVRWVAATTCAPSSPTAASARTSTTASRSSRSRCRRCASGRSTCRGSPPRSSSASARRWASPSRASPPTPSPASGRTPGRATCASSRTRSSAG